MFTNPDEIYGDFYLICRTSLGVTNSPPTTGRDYWEYANADRTLKYKIMGLSLVYDSSYEQFTYSNGDPTPIYLYKKVPYYIDPSSEEPSTEESSSEQTYTVTWMNGDDVLKTEAVAEGATPFYDGAAPTKSDDESNTYTFTGWKNGDTTYPAGTDLPAVTGDVTYTATFTSSPFVASVTSNGTTTKYTELSTALANWTDGSTLTLLADASISSAIESENVNRTLDLNGKTITMNGYDCILYVKSGSLTVNGNGGTLTGGRGGDHYGDHTRRGGAIDLRSGSLILDNCKITNNYSTYGAAIFVAQGGATLTIQNGTSITNNRGGSTLWVQGATVNMTGGTISGNYGNAVEMHSINWYSEVAKLNMSGGTISGNRGNGVVFAGDRTGQCSVSGNAVIKDNTSANLNLSGSVMLNVNGELGDEASIGITKNPGVFTNSTDTSFNDASKFFSDKSDYTLGKNADGQLVLGVPRTVTWLNDDGTTIDTTTVADGAVPTHEAPTKLGNNFAGWKNGDTTYPAGTDLPAVTGDVTYTATYKAKRLISGSSLTLDGDIIINFNIDPSAAGLTTENIGDGKQLKVNFEWTKDFGNAKDKPKTDISKYSKTILVNSDNVGGKISATCQVCAAEMSCQVRATATLNGVTDTRDYSVRDYADSVLAPREGSNFEKMKNENPTQYNKLASLVTAMVDYGAKAQKVFKINTSDLANKNLTDYEMEDVTDDMFVTAVKNANEGDSASNMKDVAAQLGANYYTSSLIFLDRSTLRHYFTKKDSTFNPSLRQ